MCGHRARYLLLLVPCHIVIALLILLVLSYTTPANLHVQLTWFVPLHVMITTSLSCWVLGRWVIPTPDRPAYFRLKAALGNALWTTFVLLAVLYVIVGGYLNVCEAIIAAILHLMLGGYSYAKISMDGCTTNTRLMPYEFPPQLENFASFLP